MPLSVYVSVEPCIARSVSLFTVGTASSVGGEAITAYTITQKDDTLFLGNINLKRELVSPTLRAFMKKQSVTYKADKTIYPNGIPQTGKTEGGHYLYRNQLGSSAREIKTFKYLETYRFGVQFQHKTGKWSEPVWINDVKNNVHPAGDILLQVSFSHNLHHVL